MQTTASPRKPRARTLTADSPLPYPPHDNRLTSEDCRLWLVWWFREASQAEALRKTAAKQRQKNTPEAAMEEALWAGALLIMEQAEESLKYVVSTGGLLFAWAGTTRLQVPS